MTTQTEKKQISTNTSLPKTLTERQLKAESYLDWFSQFTNYKHRALNPYLNWLRSNPKLSPDVVLPVF
ncbi:MAG: hypothetical protein IPP93_07860 [Chitinophagaceae bacterium]|nr:hypothetical protein [Chitinophagaceae bacterium]